MMIRERWENGSCLENSIYIGRILWIRTKGLLDARWFAISNVEKLRKYTFIFTCDRCLYVTGTRLGPHCRIWPLLVCVFVCSWHLGIKSMTTRPLNFVYIVIQIIHVLTCHFQSCVAFNIGIHRSTLEINKSDDARPALHLGVILSPFSLSSLSRHNPIIINCDDTHTSARGLNGSNETCWRKWFNDTSEKHIGLPTLVSSDSSSLMAEAISPYPP